MSTIPDAGSSEDGSGDAVREYAYVILVRPDMEGAYAEVMDVSYMVGVDLPSLHAANTVAERMGETPPYDIRDMESLAQYIGLLSMRARFNNAEGPFLVKTESPITDEQWDALVRNEAFMNRLRKEGKL